MTEKIKVIDTDNSMKAGDDFTAKENTAEQIEIKIDRPALIYQVRIYF